jgi:hypothetical protein
VNPYAVQVELEGQPPERFGMSSVSRSRNGLAATAGQRGFSVDLWDCIGLVGAISVLEEHGYELRKYEAYNEACSDGHRDPKTGMVNRQAVEIPDQFLSRTPVSIHSRLSGEAVR